MQQRTMACTLPSDRDRDAAGLELRASARRCSSKSSSLRRVLFAVSFLAGGLFWVAPATAQTPALSVTTATFTINPLPDVGSTGNAVPAPCPNGTNLVGGGGFVYKAANPATVPSTTFWEKSLDPSDASGNPVTNGSINPSVWNTDAAFGPMPE